MQDDPHHSQADDRPMSRDSSSSPAGSQTSQSTSSKLSAGRRVVELLQNARDIDDDSQGDDNWIISQDFYQEDVAADNEDEVMSGDSDESAERHRVVPLSDAESTDDDEGGNEIEDDDEANMGFELAPNEEDQIEDDTSDEEHEEDTTGGDAVDYDISIPVEHRYLGENLEESRGRRVLVENSVITLPLFNIRHIVLLPGQVLPIAQGGGLNSRIHMYLQSCISRGSCLIGWMSNPRENPYGTTAEIRSYTLSDEEELIKIILEGRQRFRLVSPPFETAIEGLVTILPEVYLGKPYLEPQSWRKFQAREETAIKYVVSKHPKQFMRNHEAHSLARGIANQISAWCVNAPLRDPNVFSYWVASNLPISNSDRLKVLQFDHTEARLLWLLDSLKKIEYLGCSLCRNVITHKENVFLMSCSGPQNSFVNSNGYVHDTLTVREVAPRSLIYQYRWSTECSWFPGYAWKIACCGQCSRHIGWCYKSTEPDTKPKKFWGLSRTSVRLQTKDNESGDEADSSQDMLEW